VGFARKTAIPASSESTTMIQKRVGMPTILAPQAPADTGMKTVIHAMYNEIRTGVLADDQNPRGSVCPENTTRIIGRDELEK